MSLFFQDRTAIPFETDAFFCADFGDFTTMSITSDELNSITDKINGQVLTPVPGGGKPAVLPGGGISTLATGGMLIDGFAVTPVPTDIHVFVACRYPNGFDGFGRLLSLATSPGGTGSDSDVNSGNGFALYSATGGILRFASQGTGNTVDFANRDEDQLASIDIIIRIATDTNIMYENLDEDAGSDVAAGRDAQMDFDLLGIGCRAQLTDDITRVWDGEIFEVIMYYGEFDAGQRRVVNDYMYAKWGTGAPPIPIPLKIPL